MHCELQCKRNTEQLQSKFSTQPANSWQLTHPINCQLLFSLCRSFSLSCSTSLSHWSQWPELEMDVCWMLVPTSLDIKISICFSIEYYSNTTPAALSILLFLFVVLFVLSFLISWATRDVEKNTHKWPSDASTCSAAAAAAAANRQPQQQHKHKPFQTGSTRRCRRRSSARQCVCVHLCSLPNALVFHLYVCVFLSEPSRRAVNRSHSL